MGVILFFMDEEYEPIGLYSTPPSQIADRSMQKHTRKAGRPSNPIPREKLVRIAVSFFADEGYRATSLDRIAQECGIRKSSLIYRFGSKEGLYIESITAILGSLSTMVGAAALSEGNFIHRLDQLSGAICDYLGTEPKAARLLFREAMDQGPFITGPQGELFSAILETAVEFLEAGDKAGEFSVSDARDLVLTIVGVHLGYFAIEELSERVQGVPVYNAESLARRKHEVTIQIRSLCGVQ